MLTPKQERLQNIKSKRIRESSPNSNVTPGEDEDISSLQTKIKVHSQVLEFSSPTQKIEFTQAPTPAKQSPPSNQISPRNIELIVENKIAKLREELLSHIKQLESKKNDPPTQYAFNDIDQLIIVAVQKCLHFEDINEAQYQSVSEIQTLKSIFTKQADQITAYKQVIDEQDLQIRQLQKRINKYSQDLAEAAHNTQLLQSKLNDSLRSDVSLEEPLRQPPKNDSTEQIKEKDEQPLVEDQKQTQPETIVIPPLKISEIEKSKEQIEKPLTVTVVKPDMPQSVVSERLMRSLKSPAQKNVSKQVDDMVNQIKLKFKERGIELPLTKKGECVYFLGNPTGSFGRKLHLSIVGGELKAKAGGGHQDFLDILEKTINKLSAKK